MDKKIKYMIKAEEKNRIISIYKNLKEGKIESIYINNKDLEKISKLLDYETDLKTNRLEYKMKQLEDVKKNYK